MVYLVEDYMFISNMLFNTPLILCMIIICNYSQSIFMFIIRGVIICIKDLNI